MPRNSSLTGTQRFLKSPKHEPCVGGSGYGSMVLKNRQYRQAMNNTMSGALVYFPYQ